MRIGDSMVAKELVSIISLRGADKNADIGPSNGGRWNAGVFQRFPCELQQDALLRIHLLCFARRDAENARVESPEIIQDPGRPGVTLSALLTARMTESIEGESVRGDLSDRTTPFQEKGPEFRYRLGTRQATSPTHDGNFVAQVVNRIHVYTPTPGRGSDPGRPHNPYCPQRDLLAKMAADKVKRKNAAAR